MTKPLQIIGSPLSPYVRKVLACLRFKGIDCEIDPLVPFFGNDRFTQISPLRRIPVLVDEAITLCDSSVICQYLEDRYPSPSLYPTPVVLRAQARWYEEFADSRLGDVFIWRFFYQLSIRQAVWGEAADKAIIDHALAVEIPEVLDWLESELPDDGYLCGDFSIADISIAAFFRNAAFVRFRTDPTRWPKVAFYIDRVLNAEPFAGLKPMEDLLLRTPLDQHRDALASLNVSLTAETLTLAEPRRGVMAID